MRVQAEYDDAGRFDAETGREAIVQYPEDTLNPLTRNGGWNISQSKVCRDECDAQCVGDEQHDRLIGAGAFGEVFRMPREWNVRIIDDSFY